MSTFIAAIIATVITMPLLGWFFVYMITLKKTRSRPTSVRVASDLSSIFFMTAVYFIMYELWKSSLLWLLIIFFLLIAIGFTVIHWKTQNDIQPGKLIKGIWRFNFLFFFMLYIVLSVYGVFLSVLNS
ncbi:DUF3397 domain-containing protein [Bacillus alkalicellulosilyticus]|uniref:DUF3397 domain-containing protein n=1 Tax=Alkalihalobacterium alkalicellulosilyticum TaxID=1912214 RepID=UPI0009963445|nr:DUF3397 domain-containing protein [Bacillus alkalicellulosilyticus]